MTRFARARGSKSSNERAPEDGTPWEVMKEQLEKAKKEGEEAKKRLEAEQQRVDNYEKFLKEQKVQKRQSTWCDFPESSQSKKPKFEEKKGQADFKKKKNRNTNAGNINNSINADNQSNLVPQEVNIENDHNVSSEKNMKKKKNKKKLDTINNEETNQNNISDKGIDNSNNERNTDQQVKKKKKNKKVKDPSNSNPNEEEKQQDDGNHDSQAQKSKPKKKNKKLIDGKPVRRKAEERSFQLIVNGKEIELVRFDGFPIMKRDSDRLTDLRNNMIRRGIPKSEVQRTIKLERRRAEKALARLKKDVCYNCRKGGHNLSDCPELKSKLGGMEGADGVCFKCGSTEHRQFECKVQKDKGFRFANCFICKEQGHIARQCPDNPKGLYPNGGCCKLCGDVTHLRKDCPTVHDKREEANVKLNTLEATDAIEDIAQKPATAATTDESSKKPKKIKF